MALAQEPGSRQAMPDVPAPQTRPVGDPQALSIGVPVRIQDSLTTGYGEAILQSVGIGTYVGRHGNGLAAPLSETLKVGVAPNLGVNLGLTNNVGDAGHAGWTVTPSFQYVFVKPHGYVPGLSVEGAYTPRPGTGLSGGSFGASGQLTQNLGSTIRSPRLHLNIEWTQLNDETRRARLQTFGYGAGVSALISDRTAIVGDIFYSQTGARGDSQTFADLGISTIIAPRLALSIGGGVGVDKSTPAGRVFISLSTSFHLFD